MNQTQQSQPKQPQGKPPKARRERPDKILPTERINFNKQLDLLRAYAAANATTGKAVSNKEAASIVKMQETTVSMANAFFVGIGLLQRHPDGGFVPSEEVKAFALAHKWNPENASHHVGPLVRATWFAEALLSKLAFQPLEEDEAITILAHAASASPEYKNQIRILIDYIVAAGLVQRDGGYLKGGKASSASTQERQIPSGGPEVRDPLPARTAPLPVAFAQQMGVVQFQISVKVDMAELAGWDANRISAFFAGIAQVLSAKGRIEEQGEGNNA